MIKEIERSAFNPNVKLKLLSGKKYSNLEVTKILNSSKKFQNSNEGIFTGAEASVKFIKPASKYA